VKEPGSLVRSPGSFASSAIVTVGVLAM